MKKRGFTIFTIIILLLVAIGLMMYQKNISGVSIVENSVENNEPISIADYRFTETYSHPTLPFSFKYPVGFTVKSTDLGSGPGGGELLVVENSEAVGFQIRIEKMDEDINVITPEMIKADLPDILIESPQEVVLGQNGRGTAFISDDPAFDGRSREVWFAFDRHFYQITTYAKYDPLLQEVLGTWEFKR